MLLPLVARRPSTAPYSRFIRHRPLRLAALACAPPRPIALCATSITTLSITTLSITTLFTRADAHAHPRRR
eukprot:1784223-Pleurochrysis_carterae.AAC.1